MAAIEDLKNELYTLDSSLWSVNVENLLRLLSFPVSLNYTCNRDEFLYEYSSKLSSMAARDRKVLSDCYEIAEYKMDKRFKRIKLFAVNLSGNMKMRNETLYDVFNVFVKLYGRYVILLAVSNGEVSFVGLSVDRKKRAEVIISDWYGYDNDNERLERLCEIDFSLFDSKYLSRIYNAYLWSIAREYVRHPESKMYLIYGCDNPITYELYVETPNSDEPVLTTRVDREETLAINMRRYLEIYGWDYFIDDRDIEIEDEDYILDEDDAEFEWTMLEMELAAEVDEEQEDDEDEFYSNSEEDDDDDYDEELIGLNPEEMLDYIRNK